MPDDEIPMPEQVAEMYAALDDDGKRRVAEVTRRRVERMERAAGAGEG